MTERKDRALAHLEKMHTELAAAEKHREKTVANLEKKTTAKAAATAKTTEAELKTLRIDFEVAGEMDLLALKAVEDARERVKAADRGVAHANADDRHEEQLKMGIEPICKLEERKQELLAEIQKIEAEQSDLFYREVVPRNDRWVRQKPYLFESAPEYVYEGLIHVLAKHTKFVKIGMVQPIAPPGPAGELYRYVAAERGWNA